MAELQRRIRDVTGVAWVLQDLPDEPPQPTTCHECGGPWLPLGQGHDVACRTGSIIRIEILAMQVRSPASMVTATVVT